MVVDRIETHKAQIEPFWPTLSRYEELFSKTL